MMKQTQSYGTINDESEPLIAKPSTQSCCNRKYVMFIVGILAIFSIMAFHPTSTNSNLISYLFSSQDTEEYTITLTVCDVQYAGDYGNQDSNNDDEYYLTLTTAEGTSEETQIPSAKINRGETFSVTLSAALGVDIRSVDIIATEADDAICINTVTVTVDEETVTNSTSNLWISGNCDNTPTLTPCDEEQTFTFLYYFATTFNSDWYTIRESCQEQGGDLAMFSTAAEVTKIYELCETSGAASLGKGCYVGFDDFETLNVWEWIDGTEFNMYDYVAPGEFDTSTWDRCGCVGLNYAISAPVADCTCHTAVGSRGSYGICQSQPIEEVTGYQLPSREYMTSLGAKEEIRNDVDDAGNPLFAEDSDTDVDAYTVSLTVCNLAYAGDNGNTDSNNDDLYYLTITTVDGSSEATKIPNAELNKGETFTMTVDGASDLGTEIQYVTITSSSDDAICISTVKVTATIDEETVSVSNSTTLWISGNCDNTPTLTPCDDTQSYGLSYFEVSLDVCDVTYAGDLNYDDDYYVEITTTDGTSTSTLIPSAQLVEGGTVSMKVPAFDLGVDVESLTVSSTDDDAICLNGASVTIDDQSYSVDTSNVWISGNCANTPTLTPCDTEQEFTFLYYFSTSFAGSYYDIRTECQSLGGDLAMFSTQAQVNEIYELCENSGAASLGKGCFLGFNDLVTLNTWLWIDGTAFDAYSFVDSSGFETSSWDRCGCVYLGHELPDPIEDCTCHLSVGARGSYGICQSQPVTSTTTGFKLPSKAKAIAAAKASKANVDDAGYPLK